MMHSVYRKQGSMKKSAKKKFMHASTSIIVPRHGIGNSLLQFNQECKDLVKDTDYLLRDIYFLDDRQIILELEKSIFIQLHSLEELDNIWEEVNDACKRVLAPFGCPSWIIELNILEEELDLNIYNELVLSPFNLSKCYT